MIEYFKSEIGLIISIFIVFVTGIGIGAAITEALGRWENEAMNDDIKAFYQQNKDFRRYIDECAKTCGRSVDYMLATRTAEEYYRSLQKGGCNEEKGDDE